METTLFDDHDVDHRPDPAERRAIRRQVLAGVLRTIRTSRGWSVNDAASQAKVSPMTWRRFEDALDVRRRSMTALDGLLELPLGTVLRALDDDLLTLDLTRLAGVDVTEVAPGGAAGFVDELAERYRSGTVGAATSSARPWPVVGPATNRALDAMAHHVPEGRPTPLDLARSLIRAVQGSDVPALQDLCRVACKALPDLMAMELHEAERDMKDGIDPAVRAVIEGVRS